jgi:hypothetical protein
MDHSAVRSYYIPESSNLQQVFDGLNQEERSSFEVQNFTNQVEYYEKELRRILKGKSASEILDTSERNRLIQYGVLIRKGRGAYVRWFVSKRARAILEE